MRHPQLPILEPIPKGLLLALFSVAVASVGGAFFLGAIPPASPALLQSLATIGAILLPAYVVEVVWLVPRMGQGEEFEEWLGFVVGAGIAGFFAIAVALLGVEHRVAGHANSLDDLGLSFGRLPRDPRLHPGGAAAAGAPLRRSRRRLSLRLRARSVPAAQVAGTGLAPSTCLATSSSWKTRGSATR